MDLIVKIIEPVVGCVSSNVAKRWKHHRDIKKNMGSLEEASERLSCRRSDVHSRLKKDVVPGETEEAMELKLWLKSVGDMTCKVEEIVKEARGVKFLSRAGMGRRVEELIPDIEKLHKEGDAFREGSLVRAVERRGNEKPTKTGLFGGGTPAEKAKLEILRFLGDKKASRIGLYGMGGSAKTTVLKNLHNDLLKETEGKLEKVIWITAGKAPGGVRGLQDKIARDIDLELQEKDDEERRASELLRRLKHKRLSVLIIDDLWEDYPLEKVGVPEDGCKLLITAFATGWNATRS